MEILFQSKFVKKLKEDLDNADLIAIIGNGGSQASAIHASSDLIKKGYPVLDLNNPCFITASSNDHSFKESYMQFFVNCRLKKNVKGRNNNDNERKFILIILTVHGGSLLEDRLWSDNLYYAAKKAKERGWLVVTITGAHGELTDLSDYYHIVPDDDVEAGQVRIMHEVIK